MKIKNNIFRLSIFTIVIALSIIIDQITKSIIANNMDLYESIDVIGGFFSITYIRNPGAGWGMLANHRWVFLLITAICIVVMPIVIYIYRKKNMIFGISVSLILGGAIGNMIDRLFVGEVVDFLDFIIFKYDFPIFNIADCCVVIGAILLFVFLIFIDRSILFDDPKKKKAKEESKTDEQVGQINDGDNNSN